MRILHDEQAIKTRIDQLARQIAADLPADFLMAPVLTGAFIFAADLIRALQKYGADPVVTLLKDFSVEVKGRHVLIVDDVLDTGRSLHFAKRMVLDRGAAEARICALVKKNTGHADDLEADYIGFEAAAEDFLIGYGMDDDGRKRGVPVIGAG
jgi:hypoxanthine phosphoribosyltransferase